MQEYRAQFLTQTLQSLNLDQVIYAGRPSKSVEDMYVPLRLLRTLDRWTGPARNETNADQHAYRKASSGQVMVPQTSGRDYVRGSHKYLYFVRVFLILLQVHVSPN